MNDGNIRRGKKFADKGSGAPPHTAVPSCVWQPIETAPKESVDRLLWWPTSHSLPATVGFWSDMRQRWIDWRRAGNYEEDWGQPTHWMPIPKPPEVTK